MAENESYLSLSDLAAAQEEDVREYFLPCDPQKKVRVRSVSTNRMREYQEAAKKGGSVERRAQCALLSESVVGLDNKPLWTTDELYNVAGKARTRWFMSVVKLVARHNGSDDEVEEVKAEETEKN
jgi:hypothetical protein